MFDLSALPSEPFPYPWELPLGERIRTLARGRRRVAYFYELADNSTFRYRIYNMAQALNHEGDVSAAYFFLADLERMEDVAALALFAERAKLDPWIARGKTNPAHGRPPVRAVDADRLIAWQLYWRGEQFWSGGEIWAWLPEMKTTFPKTENADLLKYFNDRTRAPLGRRYFVIGNAGQVPSLRGLLPTQHARDTFETEDTTSNKFSLVSFEM